MAYTPLQEKRLLEYDDLRQLELLSNPVSSPDGSLIAYCVKLPENENGTIRPTIYLTGKAGSFNLAVHAGENDQTECPVFSADGKKLGFLSDRTGCFQAYYISLAAFDPAAPTLPTAVQLTSMRHGISTFAWRQDGKRIAFSAPLFENDPVVFPQMNAEELADFEWQQAHLPKYISEIMYKFDGSWILDGSQSAVFTAAVPETDDAPEYPHRVTKERFSFDSPVYAPYGNKLFMTGKPYGHTDGLKTELFVCNDPEDEDPEVTMFSDGENYQGSPLAFRPGSDDLYYTFTATFSDDTAYNNILHSLSADGKEFTCIFPEEIPCDGVNPLHVGITENGHHSPAYQASKDGNTFYFCSGWDACCHVYALSMKKKTIRKVTEGECSVTEFAILSDTELAVLMTTETAPLDLYLYNMETMEYTPIVRHNTWLDEVKLVTPVKYTMPSDDPAMPVQGFICPPAEYEEGKTYPSFHYIHGGPEAFYAVGFDFEIQMMAAKGLALIYCNPRGSAGYGPAFTAAEKSEDGMAENKSYKDLMDFTDFALKTVNFLDPDRMGIGGGSHGGWMTNYIMGHTDRFKAAVDQRTFSNPSTSYGTGDMGYYTWSTKGASNFMEYMEIRAKQATLRTVDNYKTPCLILHGEHDLRCSLEQGEQVFSVMKARVPDVPVKMVVFPGESHGVSRIGKIHWQILHLKEMTEWVLKYTAKEEEK